jgi:hypothetical protein
MAGSFFFLVVGDDGMHDGSYGLSLLSGIALERPPNTSNLGCPRSQNLTNRCD